MGEWKFSRIFHILLGCQKNHLVLQALEILNPQNPESYQSFVKKTECPAVLIIIHALPIATNEISLETASWRKRGEFVVRFFGEG